MSRDAIRALNDAYADAVFRRDAAAWGALWTADAVWTLMGARIEGRHAIVAAWQGAMAQFGFVGFFVQLGAVTVDGDAADCVVYTHEVLAAADGSVRRPVGRYADRCVLTDEGWRFAARDFSLLWG
ncbi:nuclear transport factor 2 family protein [Sandaracinobacteroides saxicola]|uniref:Nuclear transport factor 2 family protein n=1 Tax=Sandaracinobacteroides saxicola TaxID=2759707 RepID=A0A7G5IGT8_9SPHN|nr:nuclear transport factor 2 family protein [Sandaracinobacteroides saxicola]QMW22580.1 nuclear transport factor 2 family protein [Sandaracinobacteroides saxicola]